MSRALVLINPMSGHGTGPAELPARIAQARRALASHGVEGTVHVTTGPGDAHARALAAAGEGLSLVVACGGDGTVNEVARALVRTGLALAVVPSGSGNGLARELGVPLDTEEALRLAVTGTRRVIDAGDVNGSLFFNVAGAGADARIAARFATRPFRRRGFSTYLELAADEVFRRRVQQFRIDADGEVLDLNAIVIAFANSRQYGNGALIAPAALLDDGHLDLVVVEEQPLVSIAARLPRLFAGTLREGRGLRMRRFHSVSVSSPAPVAFHVDGEPRPAVSRLDVRVHRAVLTVVAK